MEQLQERGYDIAVCGRADDIMVAVKPHVEANSSSAPMAKDILMEDWKQFVDQCQELRRMGITFYPSA